MNMLFDLSGKTALVTGSGGGLGLVMARGLATHGARVILHGRNTDKLSAAVKKLSDDGLDVHGCIFDVADSAAVKAGVREVLGKYGQIDILVNNAGINLRHPLEEFPEDEWNKTMAINLKAPWLMAKAVVTDMIRRKSGKIINICSMQSELGRADDHTLRRLQGRAQNADPGYGGRMGETRHPDQRYRAWLFQDRYDQSLVGRPGIRRLAVQPHAC